MADVSQLGQIMQLSFLGLGVLMALYAILIRYMEELFENRLKRLGTLKIERDKLLKKLNKDKDNEDLRKEYNEIQDLVKKLSRVPYHYDLGPIASGILFIMALGFSYYKFYYGETAGMFTEHTEKFLFVGILNFIYIWLRTMADLRTLTVTKFEKAGEKQIKLAEKADSQLKKAHSKPKSKSKGKKLSIKKGK